ncbi:uncharacterized membrane protein (DUF485 family) [Bradyrhizobium sp. GM2.4]
MVVVAATVETTQHRLRRGRKSAQYIAKFRGSRSLRLGGSWPVVDIKTFWEGGWTRRLPSIPASRLRSVTLASRRLRIALLLCATMITIYFGFMALFAFDKPLLGTVLAPGLSLCIVLGPLVIVSSFLLCLIYVAVGEPGI